MFRLNVCISFYCLAALLPRRAQPAGFPRSASQKVRQLGCSPQPSAVFSQFLELARHSLLRTESWHNMTGVEASGPVHNQRTILVVDDDAKILKLVAGFLGDNGYTILTAKSGAAALALAKSHAGVIHLLLSDFEMPEMAGIELATALTLVRPEIKVLMMSGFVGGMLVLNEGWHFLAKPFVASQLRSLVTSLLFPDKSRFRALAENASQLPDLKDY